MAPNRPYRCTFLFLPALWVITGGTGCSTGVVSGGGADDPCVILAEETIALSQQLVDEEEATGEIDANLACRFIANELKLVDDACIAETDLPDGIDRDTLIQQQQDFSCLQQPVLFADR